MGIINYGMSSILSKNSICILILCLFSIGNIRAQQVGKRDYQRAEKFLPKNIDSLVYRAEINPHWTDGHPVFWYSVDTRKGEEYFVVRAKERTKRPFFDQVEFAQNLSPIIGEKVSPFHLPIHSINWEYSNNSIQFKIEEKKGRWKADLKTLKINKLDKEEGNPDHLSAESPDGKWTVTRKEYNLWLKNNETGKKYKLTEDGKRHYIYGASLPWADTRQILPSPDEESAPFKLTVRWSQNSKKLYVNKLDLRRAQKLYLLKNIPQDGFRSQVFSYYRALPGEDSVAKIEPYIFNIEDQTKIPVQLDPFDAIFGGMCKSQQVEKADLYFICRERGYGSVSLLDVDTGTGKVDTVFHQTSRTYIDPLKSDYKFLPKTNEFLWLSERDGWNHIYLYDLKTGAVKQQITDGKYVVKHINHVDKQNRTIYFTAGGREPDRDPYLNHLYRVNFDGSNLTLLTPENATHSISLSPGHKFFVDTYSRVDKKPQTVLRKLEDGSVIMKLETADIKDLLATGWQYPQPFKVKARDDKTDIYGVIIRPSNFDPKKKYPVIDGTYSGPHAVRTPKSFVGGYKNQDQPLAELGFVVINVDGLGTGGRSKQFQDYSWKNLGDIGSPDHIKAIKELTQTYPYMDSARVGIYGHSAGGYDAARAIMKHPEFYKVAVSSAGNHDHRVAKAWWPELYMDYPSGRQYAEQSNMKLVENLEGQLLIAHGNMDDNVHPAETYRLADALIKAGKSFDMLIMPGKDHGGIYSSEYFIKKRWNYFVEHLLGAEPLRHYKINHGNE